MAMRELLSYERAQVKVKTYTFSVTVDSVEPNIDSVWRYIQSMLEDEGFGPFDSVKVAPITGLQRQHLIGDTDND